MLESLEWKFLPVQGGLMDQPDWLFEDLATISWRRKCVADMMIEVPQGIPVRKGS
jgi:hypothetical protein